jgi:hypothetical protein
VPQTQPEGKTKERAQGFCPHQSTNNKPSQHLHV